MKVKLGLPSNLFAKQSLEASLSRVWKLNPEAVELVLDKPHITAEELEDGGKLEARLRETLRSLSPKREISVHANFQRINPSSLSFQQRSRSLRLLEECLRISAGLEAKVLVVHPGWLPPASRVPLIGGIVRRLAWKALQASMKACLKLSENYGVTVGLENIHGKLSPFTLPSQASNLSLEGLKFTFDLGHAYIEARRRLKMAGGEAERWIAGEVACHLQGKLAHVHLHDNRGLTDTHLPPGEGEIDFNPMVEALEKAGFQGQVILEVWNPENPEASGRKALEAARRIFSR
ncbi:MAG: sugar phosphate isomerase/epimerase family protein [Candidatus Hecatellaceae archaeon]